MGIAVIEMPVNLLSVAGGRISVKVAVPNRPAVVAVLPAEKIVENLAIIESSLKIEHRNRYMAQQHQAVYASIVGTVTDHIMTEETSIAVCVAALWCALNHPRDRNEMRKALGSYLKASARGFVGFEAFPDGKVSIGVDQAPISDATMERAKDGAAELNQEGKDKAQKALH